nr:MAG TPA: hypothetical protein [Caudoviricetes sp.]
MTDTKKCQFFLFFFKKKSYLKLSHSILTIPTLTYKLLIS